MNSSAWSRLAKSIPSGEAAEKALAEMTRVWVASLRRAGPEKLYDPREVKKLSRFPAAIKKLADGGAGSQDAARHFSEFAKEYVSGLAQHPESGVAKEPTLARWVLVTACCFTPSKGASKPFFAWVVEAGEGIGISPDDLRKEILKQKWITAAVRKAVTDAVKPKPEPKKK